jgi:hypothetical protein
MNTLLRSIIRIVDQLLQASGMFRDESGQPRVIEQTDIEQMHLIFTTNFTRAIL